MKALVMKRYGGPKVMGLGEVPMPKPGPNDVLIEVHAAGLNPVDWKIRAGHLKAALPFKLPIVMGNELSGVIKEIGSAVRSLKVGDEVYTRVDKMRIGAIAEYVASDESLVARKPKSISHAEAAGVPLAALTAWQCLFDRMQIKRGQKVLVHAGAGGVGTFAIQFAKNAGAYVATTASSRNHEFLKSLGADQCIDYSKGDFTQAISDCDGVLDAVGGKTTIASMKVVKRGGWVVSISNMPDPVSAKEMGLGAVPRLFLSLITRKEVGAARKAGINYRFLFLEPRRDQLENLAELIDAGKVKVVVDSVYPFEKFADAFAKLETGHARGKIVIEIKRP